MLVLGLEIVNMPTLTLLEEGTSGQDGFLSREQPAGKQGKQQKVHAQDNGTASRNTKENVCFTYF